MFREWNRNCEAFLSGLGFDNNSSLKGLFFFNLFIASNIFACFISWLWELLCISNVRSSNQEGLCSLKALKCGTPCLADSNVSVGLNIVGRRLADLPSSSPLLLVSPWCCETLPVISGMSSPAQERTGLNVALSWTGQVVYREALFHYSPPCVAVTKICSLF